MNGIIIIDKPSGYTSHDIVAIIRRITKVKRVGHAGTLDPLATGVLPILIGSATKLSATLTGGDKEYIATIKFGEKRDTDDAKGVIVETKDVPKDLEVRIKEVLPKFLGKITQRVPDYSAVKKEGRTLYKMARRGEKFEAPLREVNIENIEIMGVEDASITVRVKCSKGTYIRALARDMGEAIGTFAHISALRRTVSSGFKIEAATKLSEISTLQDVERMLHGRQLL